jgi:uncharacterized protein YcfJ
MKKSTMKETLAALALVVATGCNTAPQGALTGGLLGAGAGAVVGNQSGNQGEGALIGGALGAISGALIGNDNERRRSTPNGYWETRTVTRPNGETYQERVWVPR